MIKIKTKEEISILREGGKRHAEIMRNIVKLVVPGVSTSFLNDETTRMIIDNGDTPSLLNFRPSGSKRPYPASICISVNDEIVHGIPNENPKILKEGDIVSLDFAMTHNGMVTDMAVTVPVGQVSEEYTELMEVTKKALMAGIKAGKGGKKVGDISSAIEKVGIMGGYGIVEELCGHGVGYSVHEEPMIPNYGEPNTGDKLVPGMVLAIEPMFNLGERHLILDEDGYTYRTRDGKVSAHFEHTVVITKSEPEILTL